VKYATADTQILTTKGQILKVAVSGVRGLVSGVFMGSPLAFGGRTLSTIGCLAKRWTCGRSCSCDISRPQTRETKEQIKQKKKDDGVGGLLFSCREVPKPKQKIGC